MEQNNTAKTTDTTAIVCSETWLTQSEVNVKYGTRVGNVLSSAAKNTTHTIDRRKREGSKRWEYKERDINAWIKWQEDKAGIAKQREDAQTTNLRSKAVLIHGMNAQELVDKLTQWGNDLNEQGKDLVFKEVSLISCILIAIWLISNLIPHIWKLVA